MEFSWEEKEFIKSYGSEIAEIMLYAGDSHISPRDDAPKIVDVFTNTEEGRCLEVGIARPRALLVLYPYKGKEILCIGGVLPFYEFTSKDRLNDREWKKMLDSKNRPSVPSWLKPLVGSKGITKPEMKGY